MSPIVFESLLFLKTNVRYWDVRTVSVAIKRADKSDNGKDDAIFERDADEFY